MSDYKVTDSELTGIANAIRTKGGTSSSLVFPDGFTSAIGAIPTGGGGTIQQLSVNTNGTYTPPSGVDGYAPVVVNVSSGSLDEGVLFEYDKFGVEFNSSIQGNVVIKFPQCLVTHDIAFIKNSSSDTGYLLKTAEKIDVTNYSKLCMKCLLTDVGASPYFSYLSLCSAASSWNSVTHVLFKQLAVESATEWVEELDISSLSGSYYVTLDGFGLAGTVSKIWLE